MYQHIQDRQFTAADIERNPLIRANWRDYIDALRDRLIARSQARWRQMEAQRRRGVIVAFPVQRLICVPDLTDATGGDAA